MKKILRLSSIAICAALTVVLVACGTAATAIKKSDLTLNSADKGYTAETPIAAASITDEDNDVVKVTVPAETSCVVLNLKAITSKTDVLGNALTFARSDVSGKGYAYTMVTDNADPKKATWKKYGAADSTAKAEEEQPQGLCLFIRSNGDAELYVYAKRDKDDKNKPIVNEVFKTGITKVTVTIKGDNKDSYKLKLHINVA